MCFQEAKFCVWWTYIFAFLLFSLGPFKWYLKSRSPFEIPHQELAWKNGQRPVDAESANEAIFHLLCGSKNRQGFITSLSSAFVMFPVLCGTSCYILYCFSLDEVDSYLILFVMLWKHPWGQMLTSYCLVGPRVSLITWHDGKASDQLPNADLAAFINTNLTPSFHHPVLWIHG